MLKAANDLAFHVARSLLALRRLRGLSQSALAKLVGTSQAKIARLEMASENPTVRTVVRLCEALRGRIRFSIEPAERVAARPTQRVRGARKTDSRTQRDSLD